MAHRAYLFCGVFWLIFAALDVFALIPPPSPWMLALEDFTLACAFLMLAGIEAHHTNCAFKRW